jgi:retron-type reverse transcriptase
VVDIDLSKFFDRVHHQRLLDRIAQRFSDRRLLAVVRRMLKAGVVMPDGMKIAVTEGTPSPLLSNIVLDELDWKLERRGHRFVRPAHEKLLIYPSITLRGSFNILFYLFFYCRQPGYLSARCAGREASSAHGRLGGILCQ